jgi:hypothetical protein
MLPNIGPIRLCFVSFVRLLLEKRLWSVKRGGKQTGTITEVKGESMKTEIKGGVDHGEYTGGKEIQEFLNLPEVQKYLVVNEMARQKRAEYTRGFAGPDEQPISDEVSVVNE